MRQAGDFALRCQRHRDIGADAAPADGHGTVVEQRFCGQRPPARFAVQQDRHQHVPERHPGGETRAQGLECLALLLRRAFEGGVDQVEKIVLEQGRLGTPEHPRHAPRHVGQQARLVDLPQPIAGVFLEIAQQQTDELALALALRFGHQARPKGFRVREHAAHHDQRVDHQQGGQLGGEGVIHAHQPDEGAHAQHANVGQRGLRHGGQRKAAGAEHARGDRDQHDLLLARADRQHDDRHHRPQQGQQRGVFGRPVERPVTDADGALAALPAQPRLDPDPGRIQHAQRPGGQHQRIERVAKRPPHHRRIERVGEHGERCQAQHPLNLARAKTPRQRRIGPVGRQRGGQCGKQGARRADHRCRKLPWCRRVGQPSCGGCRPSLRDRHHLRGVRR